MSQTGVLTENPNWNDSFLELTFFLLLGIEAFFFLIILLPFFLSEEVYILSESDVTSTRETTSHIDPLQVQPNICRVYLEVEGLFFF